MGYIVKPKKGFFTIENIEEKNIAEFDEEGMSLHGINRNLQRNIAMFYDNLKVVHRRLLYAMATMGLRPNKHHSKAAGVIGRTIEKFHPHGDAAAYEALIFMGQPWRNIMTLVDIEGNYGNAENPNEYAQMRYVKCRLSSFAWDCYFSEWDLKSDLVDMRPTFSGDDLEPIYLPAKYPLFLMNWGSGMGYGLATSSPGFLPQDAMQAVIDLIKDPNAKIVLYPEDPMGCTIVGKKVFQKFTDFNFNKYKDDDLLKFRVRSDYVVENGIIRILNTPYEVNPETVIKKIVNLKNKKKIDGIVDMEVELKPGKIPQLKSKSDTMNIIIEYSKGVDPHILMEKLYKLTQLETTFSLNCVYVDMNKNVKFNLRESILYWIKLRRKVLKRMYRAELTAKSKRNYVLDALIMLFDKNQIDTVINIFKKNKRSDVQEILIRKYGISDYQAEKISEMRFGDLSPDSYNDYVKEREENKKKIKQLQEILKNRKALDNIIISQMEEGIKKYYRPRQSKIIEALDDDREEQFFDIEVLNTGHVRKIKHGSDVELNTEESSLVSKYENIGDSNKLFVFTNTGLVFSDSISKIRTSKDKSLGSIISKKYDPSKYNTVGSVIAKENTSNNVICITKFGLVKNSKLSDYFISSQGSYGIKLAKNDELVSVLEFTPNDIKNSKIMVYTKNGKCSIFQPNDVTSRFTMGSTGIKLEDGDYVIGADIVKSNDEYMVTISENGHVKKFSIENTFNNTKRGMPGIAIVSSGENLYRAVTVNSKITKLLLVSLQGIEEVNLADIQLKTRLSAGEKLLRARRRGEIILKR